MTCSWGTIFLHGWSPAVRRSSPMSDMKILPNSAKNILQTDFPSTKPIFLTGYFISVNKGINMENPCIKIQGNAPYGGRSIAMNKRQQALYCFLCLSMKLLGSLPLWAANLCAGILGRVWFAMDARHRKITLSNLARAYGKEWSRSRQIRTARQVFINTVSMVFEIAWAMQLSPPRLLSHFTIKGLSHVQSAHKKGKGIIALTCHMGNFEMFSRIVEQAGVKCYGVYRKMDSPALEQFMLDSREGYGITMIPLRKASGKIKNILGQGGLVGTLLDQNQILSKGVFTDFFGTPACTNSALAKLVLDTGASVVPCYTTRKNRKFFVEFLPEIPVENTGDRIRDIQVNTQNFTTAIEGMVRKCPEQYFWVHNRWKTKPVL